MKVILDNSNLFAGGGLQVAASFLKDLRASSLSIEFHVIQSVKMVENLEPSFFPSNFVFYNLGTAEEGSIFKRRSRVRLLENQIQPDCIFTLFGPSYHKSKFPKIVGFAIPYIVYPDSPFFKKLSIKNKLHYKVLDILKTYCFKKYSDVLIFETEDAQSIFSRRSGYKKQSFVVGNTLNEIFFSSAKLPAFSFAGSSVLNVLFLTANYPHKNMAILPAIIRSLKEVHHLTDFKFLISLNKKDLQFPSFCDEHVIYLGKIDLNQIPSLYSQVQIVFIPTLLEVFSATYLEAMYMQKPIVASDMGFSRDICGDAALFCTATSPESYAEAIVSLQNDSFLQNDLVAKGIKNLNRFGTSKDRTLSYLKIIEKIVNTYENSK